MNKATVGCLMLCAISSLYGAETIDVVLLAGQSYMAGNAPIADVSAEMKQPPQQVVLLSSGKSEVIGSGRSFGPEIGFSKVISAARPKQQFLLVKHAKGGTSLAGWAPKWDKEKLASKYDASAGPLYRTLMDQYAAAVAGKNVRLTAILWMQGESDSRYPALGPNYFGNLKTLIEAFRRDLKDPNLPFLMGRVNTPADMLDDDKKSIKFRFISNVRAAQEKAVKEIPNVYLIETDDLPKQRDRIHYDAKGQLELGKRFADVWLKQIPDVTK
ncbi:MAG: sialate O-acetylesterase [bacterium]